MSFVKSEEMGWIVAGLAIAASLLVAAGCAKSGGGGASAQADAALIASGKGVFDANGCARCHAIGGQGGAKGPDLTRVGADPAHTPQWLVEHVKNPRVHSPSSRMPSFEGRINDQGLLALGAYLASLK